MVREGGLRRGREDVFGGGRRRFLGEGGRLEGREVFWGKNEPSGRGEAFGGGRETLGGWKL